MLNVSVCKIGNQFDDAVEYEQCICSLSRTHQRGTRSKRSVFWLCSLGLLAVPVPLRYSHNMYAVKNLYETHFSLRPLTFIIAHDVLKMKYL